MLAYELIPQDVPSLISAEDRLSKNDMKMSKLYSTVQYIVRFRYLYLYKYLMFRIYRKLSSLPFWNQRGRQQPAVLPEQPPELPQRRCLTIPGGLTIEVGSRGARRLVFGSQLRETENGGGRGRRVTLPRMRGGSDRSSARRLLLSGRRGNRTLYLLLCVVVVFVISWLPLNTLNLLLDLGFKDYMFG
jgi:hypothetical protein